MIIVKLFRQLYLQSWSHVCFEFQERAKYFGFFLYVLEVIGSNQNAVTIIFKQTIDDTRFVLMDFKFSYWLPYELIFC